VPAASGSIKIMHSKWGDATLQVMAFDRLSDDDLSLEGEPFCNHIMHLFKQLSALATMHLHGAHHPRPCHPRPCHPHLLHHRRLRPHLALTAPPRLAPATLTCFTIAVSALT